MKFRSALASAFALAALVATSTIARADPDPTATGFWQYQDDEGHPIGWFLFSQKNEVYSARLVKGFKKQGDDTPPQLTCVECPGKKKGAHIMGLTLFWGMKRDGLNYSDGSVMDPRDGSIYHAKMWIDPDGQTLHVRGFLGISMFGQTQDWHRLPDDAMKKEEVPKEILANGEDASGDKTAGDKAGGDKPKHVAKAHKKGDKSKTDTAKSDGSEAADAQNPDATPAATPDKAQ